MRAFHQARTAGATHLLAHRSFRSQDATPTELAHAVQLIACSRSLQAGQDDRGGEAVHRQRAIVANILHLFIINMRIWQLCRRRGCRYGLRCACLRHRVTCQHASVEGPRKARQLRPRHPTCAHAQAVQGQWCIEEAVIIVLSVEFGYMHSERRLGCHYGRIIPLDLAGNKATLDRAWRCIIILPSGGRAPLGLSLAFRVRQAERCRYTHILYNHNYHQHATHSHYALIVTYPPGPAQCSFPALLHVPRT